MLLEYKKLNLFGHDTIIKASGKAPMTIRESLADEACFYFVINGTTEVLSGSDRLLVGQREGIVLHCGNYLGKFLEDYKDAVVELVIVKLPKDMLEKIFEDLHNFLEKQQRNVQKINMYKTAYNKQLEQYIESLLFYIEHPDLAIEELLVLKIKELMILLASTDRQNTIFTLLSRLYKTENLDRKKIIEHHKFSRTSISELAHLCAMSEASFKRFFQKTYGVAPGKYFGEQRMQKAHQMLMTQKYTVTEVADACGYEEVSNFSAAFRKYFGFAPSMLKITETT